MPRLEILGHSILTPEPYAPGHRCTAAEASVLNSALTRGLAKGLYRLLRETYEKEERLTASEGDKAACAEFIRSYLKGFSEGHERLRSIEAEARRIARARAESAVYRTGKSFSKLPKGEQEELIAREASSEACLAEATRRIDTLRSIGDFRGEAASLEEFVGGTSL